jgi:hypothetical protein
MNPQFLSMSNSQVYISIWNKYRPAIIKLMLASTEGPLQYKLFDHEFTQLNAREKAYAFELHVHRGKATNNIRSSAPAQDLLSMLNTSRKASELLDVVPFSFTLDKKFILTVARMELPG